MGVRGYPEEGALGTFNSGQRGRPRVIAGGCRSEGDGE